MERWKSGNVSLSTWQSTETFLRDLTGPFQLIWRGKRIKKNGVFGDGDLAIDDVRILECTAAERIPPPTTTPSLGKNLVLLSELSLFSS